MADLDKVEKLWQMVTDQVKKRTVGMGFWQAMETVTVLDWEDGPPLTIVLGLTEDAYVHAGHLEVPENRNLIEQVLREITRQEITIRVVACGSREDWATFKVAEERKRAAHMAMVMRGPKEAARPRPIAAPEPAAGPAPELPEGAIRSADDFLERAYRVFNALPNRTLRQTRARFVIEAVQMLAAAEGQLAASGMHPETIARLVDRAIERIAVWGECDSGAVALEYVRRRGQE